MKGCLESIATCDRTIPEQLTGGHGYFLETETCDIDNLRI